MYQDPRYRDPEYRAKWAAAHPERAAEYSRRRLNTPEKREANRVRASLHYHANREHRKEQARAYYRGHREQTYIASLARKFGLSPEAYHAMREAQGGVCAICGSDGRLSVDHSHSTGVVRGLLCQKCNFMVGHGDDDPAVLRKAATYLETRQ